MIVALCFTILLPLQNCYEIKATGNGIVKSGSDLELSLIIGEAWDRCQWFSYDSLDEYKYCSFDLDAESGIGQVSHFLLLVYKISARWPSKFVLICRVMNTSASADNRHESKQTYLL